MTDAQVIALINQYIVTNGNNEITAAVLNPILQAIRQRSQDVTGDPEDLTTTDTSNLVAAINSLKSEIDDFEFEGVQVYSGLDNPNDTPPIAFNVADFYKQLDGGGDTIALWQYSGTEWVNLTEPPYVGSLQEVTESGATTNVPIVVTDESETESVTYNSDGIAYDAGGFTTEVKFAAPSANRSQTIQDKDGTIALLSDLANTPAIANGTFKLAMKGSQSGVANTDLNVIEINDWCLKLGTDGEGGFWQYTGGGDTDPANYIAIITATGNS